MSRASRPVKVLFTFQGLPHYYNYVLNRLNGVEGLEIVNVVATDSEHMGAGVFQARDDIAYRLHELPEYKPWFGGSFLKGLWRILLHEKPDVVVTLGSYLNGFRFEWRTRLVMALCGSRLIRKDIPFRLDSAGRILVRMQEDVSALLQAPSPRVSAIRRSMARVGVRGDTVQKLLTRLHNPLRRVLAEAPTRRIVRQRRRSLHWPDAHVHYVEAGRELFASYGVPSERVFVTYNSPDSDRLLAMREALLADSTLERRPLRLIHIGRLVEWKRVDLLLRALVACPSALLRSLTCPRDCV